MSVLDVRQVGQVGVLKAGRRAATLTREPDHVVFRYDDDYLAGDPRPVATTLPLTEEPVRTPGRAVPPFFANLLPEGRRLTALRRHVKTSADDDLSLLVAVGGDPVGDVQVVTDAVEPGPVDLVPTGAASFADLSFADLLDRAGIGDPAALAGVQDKVSGRMLTLPLAHAGRSVLLKFEVPEYPHVVENESYFLTRARRLRHPVVSAEVVHDRTGRPGLLVTRFDRVVGPDGALHRLAVEDGAQLLNRYPADKYAVSSEEVAERLAAVCDASVLAVRAWFVQLLYAWLTGNGDLHAKNVSVLSRDDEWRVAPIYDVPATACYGDTTLALSVGGRIDGVSGRAWREFGVRIGLPARAVESAVHGVLEATDGLADDLAAGALPFDPRRRRDLVRTLTFRRRLLTEPT